MSLGASVASLVLASVREIGASQKKKVSGSAS